MADSQRIHLTGLARLDTKYRWCILIACSLLAVTLLRLINLPAAILIGAMASGVFLSVSGGPVRIPLPLLFAAQSVVGCLISRSVSKEIISDVVHNWPLFVLMVGSVTVVSFVLGYFLVKSKRLPGTTGIWGSSPGAALVMTMMSESYGADSRLVALMQYSRVMLVSLIATAVAGIWGNPVHLVATTTPLAAFDYLGFAQTMLLAAAGTMAGVYVRLRSGPILVPLILGSFLNVSGIIHIELPWWLLWVCYSVVGWSIGLRFTRQIVVHAIKALPLILGTIVILISVCGLLAVFLAKFAGIDPMTAYLATSPGGMDAIAIISASMPGSNTSFIMAVQVSRFVLVSLTSPPLTSYIVKRAGWSTKRESKRM